MSHENEKTLPLKSVYSYYFPETRKIIDGLVKNYPHEIFLQSINPGLDDYHIPVIENYIKHFESQTPDLKNFPYKYVTAGASEGIFHYLAKIASSDSKKLLYVLEGEYEGYAGYGQNLGLKFNTVHETEDFKSIKPGIVFISNPSARDGNIIGNDEIISIADAGHKIIYDTTYVGLTDPHHFNLDHENIIAVLSSMSKPFGLYYYRVGFAFSKIEMKTLEVNKWFKNIFSLTIANEILTKIGDDELVKKYRSYQKESIARMSNELNLNTSPSDVVLLSNAQNGDIGSGFENYSRKHNYRFCLTPYFLEKEVGK